MQISNMLLTATVHAWLMIVLQEAEWEKNLISGLRRTCLSKKIENKMCKCAAANR